nr:hypothetical protein [Tanacetum cinerariifolium]
MTLTFADTHNMIAYLIKFDASEGFNQIIDFLNGSSIKYTLTVNPNIYVSCIKQFCNTVSVKQVNEVKRLQALVNKKRVIITEATIRDALGLDDVEGIECLPNEEIFTELERMGYEKPSTKLTFYKAFFSSQWKVKKLERMNKLKVLKLRRLKKVGIAQQVETFDNTVMDDVSKQGRIIADMDADKDVTLKDVVIVAKDVQDAEIEESSYTDELQEVVEIVTTAKLIAERRRKGVVIRDLEESATPSIIIQSEAKSKDKAQAKKNMMIYLRNVVGFKMDCFKGMTYDDIHLIFEKKFSINVAFLQKTKEQMDEKDSRALKRLSESQKDKAAKKQKLDEEVEELRRHLQIVPNDEDDVYTEATPLARKVPVVDYEIYTENNKLYYKIKRVNGSHQQYLSFLSMLRNFDREDLEVLWQLVKERFASTKPNNFSDDFLLMTLGAMFEKPEHFPPKDQSNNTTHCYKGLEDWTSLILSG